MTTRNIIPYTLLFLLMVFLQAFFFRNTAIYELAFCFVYVYVLLLLPLETEEVYVIIIGFLLGLSIDVFYDTMGIHASASVLMAFARRGIINLLAPSGGYDGEAKPVLREQGFQWVVIYGLILISLHHFALFFIESSNSGMLLRTIIVSISSTTFTLFVFLLYQFFFYSSSSSKRRRR